MQHLILYFLGLYLGIMVYKYSICWVVLLLLMCIFDKHYKEILIMFILGYIRFSLSYISNNIIHITGNVCYVSKSIVVVNNAYNTFVLYNNGDITQYGQVSLIAQIYRNSIYGNIVKSCMLSINSNFIILIKQHIVNYISTSKYSDLYLLLLFGISHNSNLKNKLIDLGIYYNMKINNYYMKVILNQINKVIKSILSYNFTINYNINIIYMKIIINVIIGYFIYSLFNYNMSILYAIVFNIYSLLKMPTDAKISVTYITIGLINPYHIFYNEFILIFIFQHLCLRNSLYVTRLLLSVPFGSFHIISLPYIKYLFIGIIAILCLGIIFNINFIILFIDKVIDMFFYILSYMPVYIINFNVSYIAYISWILSLLYTIIFNNNIYIIVAVIVFFLQKFF